MGRNECVNTEGISDTCELGGPCPSGGVASESVWLDMGTGTEIQGHVGGTSGRRSIK